MVRAKNKPFVEKGSAAEAGHNSKADEKTRIEIMADYIKQNEIIREARGRQKDLLNRAKNNGFLKTSIKNAVKEVEMTEEQWQAKREVEEETKLNVKLFAEKSGQLSWLQPDASDEEAA